MKIVRYLNGVFHEWELTDRELHDAYYEYEMNCARDNVREALSSPYAFNAEKFPDERRRALAADNEFVDNAAGLSIEYNDGDDAITESMWQNTVDAVMHTAEDWS